MNLTQNIKRRLFGFLLLPLLSQLNGCSYHHLLPKGPDITVAAPIKQGKDSFVMNAYTHTDRKTVRVWTFKPDNWQQHDKVLFVMHGMSRNAENYLDAWIEIAKQQNTLLIAPEFHNKKFYKYTTNDYQDGNLYNFFGGKNPRNESAFQVIDNIIAHIDHHNPFNIEKYNMFGHSAGSQFVHRMVILAPDDRLKTAVAANAGVYTFPDERGSYPYNLPDRAVSLAEAFEHKLIILLGEKDNNANGGTLNESTLAMKQGPHRLARGQKFYRVSQQLAAQQGHQFNWQIKQVANVGHNKIAMIEAAAKFF